MESLDQLVIVVGILFVLFALRDVSILVRKILSFPLDLWAKGNRRRGKVIAKECSDDRKARMPNIALLREIRDTQQVPGEPLRRWFFSHEQDLLVWLGADGQPVAFQLAYGKYHDEHAIRWKAYRGFTHYRVDDSRIRAPLLLPAGAFAAKRVLERFLGLSDEVPKEIVNFVAARLREHPDHREDT